ncbi:DNA polymerase III subunit beta [Microbacterium sp. AISO3]|uniref:Beta sliding clamp n=2 Tax=Microbacterium TaxID=33882 RepID=A0ABU1I4S7_9MICO|nr:MULTISPECIES: DNA polymerase III subunit beta [Microbacterium]APF34656.1 DNA polymerase III subunit beta [Microbacterium paludicola]MDR6167944.1 DNA polymerase-3 subunit beta [Microbacterium paludicola]OAZ44595.1 DNA polymerase III subunit beta [Microbacterium arborescens]OWP20376.1 DNA polymerase III subunit beta [Microbacterium sp. AISO3]OWP23471.1 DNA polymerase III subunit beta [Microbacterium sp. AISO3]
MKFQVNRDVFSEAVSFVVKLLPQRNPQPILAGVLIEATDTGLSLSAFDYEASARTTIEATVDEPGTILVHGRLLSEIASRLPNAPIQIAVDDDGILLTCGSARFTLASMPVQEYPAIPEVSGESGVVPAEDFATAISQVAFAASRDDVTPVLTGVQLEVTGTQLSLVATDRYRVALRDIPFDSGIVADENTTTALVPARTLTEVGKTFAHSGDITVSFSGSGDREIIAFTAGNKTVTSLLIKGNFPPVRRLFPEATDHHAVVNTGELIEAVRRVALVLDRSAPLRFTFGADGVSMDASGTEQARATESVDATLTGEEVVIGLNPQYLLEALAAVKSEFTRVTFTSSENANKLSPILITPQTSGGVESFKYLLQPNLLLR